MKVETVIDSNDRFTIVERPARLTPSTCTPSWRSATVRGVETETTSSAEAHAPFPKWQPRPA
jgi:hypothetical protein